MYKIINKIKLKLKNNLKNLTEKLRLMLSTEKIIVSLILKQWLKDLKNKKSIIKFNIIESNII